MTMKVSSVNNVHFKSGQTVPVSLSLPEYRKKISNISNVTPDFAVKTPVNYRLLGTEKLDNGLDVYSYKLSNGYRVTIVPMEDSPAVVKSYVNVGSLNETSDIKGISHFLEHMAFNGTNGEDGHIKLETGDSFKKIDEIGGWANASTNYAMTDYVNSSPLLNNKDIETQIKIIAAMSEDLKLSEDMIKKEKGPVSSEINMILDDPKTIAMDQTVRTLFNIKNPADELVGGSVKHIQSLTQQDVADYYNKYYTPDNTNIVITGNVTPEDVIKIVAKNFVSRKVSKGQKFEEKITPIERSIRKDFISDKANSAEIILGFAGPKNNNTRDKIVYDIVKQYLQSQTVGLNKNLKQYNSYPFIFSERISTNPNNPRMITLSASSSEENCQDVLQTIYKTFSDIKPITESEMNNIKDGILMARKDFLDCSQDVNFDIGTAVLDGDLSYSTKYKEILTSITKEEVNEKINQFFDLNKAAITVVHPKTNQHPAFKGKETRQPVNIENISTYKLKNNYEIGFFKTKSDNIFCNLSLKTDKPYNQKPGVISILDEIYSMGMKGISEDSLNKIKEDNNLTLYAVASPNGISINADSNLKNYKKNILLAKRLLFNPNITEKNVEEAKGIIKDRLSRSIDTSASLYFDFESSKNPYEYSKKEILDALDSITTEDVIECHKHLLNNSSGIITANTPINNDSNATEAYIIEAFSRLPNVKSNNFKQIDYFRKNDSVKVITKSNSNSQADILEAFSFESSDDIKEGVVGELMNSILNSSSIGLFDNLREKENLAYSVHSEISKTGNRGEILLNILTTTDNKEIGEIKYENIQKSIDGFNNQIKELLDGKFTEDDLESAKKILKSKLLNNESRVEKIGIVNKGLNSKYGIKYINEMYSQIDTITKNDIMNFAQKAFCNKPVYSILATEDTLKANREYLDQIKNN